MEGPALCWGAELIGSMTTQAPGVKAAEESMWGF